MAERLGDAVLELKTRDIGFESGIERAESRARKLGRTLDAIGLKAQRLGSQLTTFLTVPLVTIGALSVKTASDVQEMQSLFEVTFGESAAAVEDWAKRTAAANNRSRFEFMRMASDFAAFLKPLGVAPDMLVPMSQALTQLTTDISSFRNMTEEETFTRLFSGLAGETEAVRRLGIDIGAAAVEAELLRMGINKTQAEATQAEKVMARFSLIMRQTTDAQGDAVRTSASFENQLRGLGATIQDIRVAIGQRFLPIAQRLITRIRELGEAFLALPQNVQSGIIAITTLVGVIGPAIFALGLFTRAVGFAVGGLAFIPKVMRAVWVAIRTTIIGVQAALVGFLAFFSTIPGLIVVGLSSIVGAFFIFRETVIGFFRGLILAIRDAFVAGFNNKVVIPFQRAINALIEKLPGFISIEPIQVNDVIENSFTEDMRKVIGDAVESGKEDMQEFRDTTSRAVDTMKGKFAELKAAIGRWIPDIELADFTLENLGDKFDELLRSFSGLQDQLVSTGEAAQDGAEAGIEAFDYFGKSVRSSVEDNLTDALSRVRSFGDAAMAIVREVAQAFIRFRIVRPFVERLPLPGFAEGGNPPVGRPSIVGEEGPELFVPRRAGTIIPNHALAGMGGLTQNFNFPLAFPTQLEAFIRNIAAPAGREAAMQAMEAQRGRI